MYLAKRSGGSIPISTVWALRAFVSAPSACWTGRRTRANLLTWISHRDMVQLSRRCIDYPDYHFIIAYGVSKNLRSRWDNTNVKFLGYAPQDDSEQFAAEIFAEGKKENEIAAQFHGGFYTPMEFAGDPSAID